MEEVVSTTSLRPKNRHSGLLEELTYSTLPR